MHEYSGNCRWKLHLNYILVIISIGLAVASGFLASFLNASFGITVSGISGLASYFILHAVFDNKLWKYRYIRSLLMVPDLNGKWKVQGITLRKNGKEKNIDWVANIFIVQSWTKITIALQASKSSSKSSIASIQREGNGSYVLTFVYKNDTDLGKADLDMLSHTGAAKVIFNNNTSQGSGVYFTNENRTTAGTLKLTRCESGS